jgi:hypothetical protein
MADTNCFKYLSPKNSLSLIFLKLLLKSIIDVVDTESKSRLLFLFVLNLEVYNDIFRMIAKNIITTIA